MAVQQEWPSGAAAAEWRAHWPLVVASSLGYTMIGVGSYSLGAFMAPLHKAFGWSRSEITAGFTIYALTCVVCQPIVGRMIDRFGPRRIALAGLVLYGGALSSFATASGSFAGWLLLWQIYSLSAQLVLTPVWTSAVASEFDAGRAMALALTLAGSALPGIVVPFAATVLIDRYGWRTAYPILGGGVAAVLWIVTYFLFYSRFDRLRDSAIVSSAATSETVTGLSIREALLAPAFWKMGTAILISFTLAMAFAIHMLPILSSAGLSRDKAGLVAGGFGLSAVLGKIAYGLLVRRFPGQKIAAVMVVLPALACGLLLSPHPSVAICGLAITLAGASSGAQLQLLVYLTTRHFGMRSFGAIFGFISWSVTIASATGPLLAGRLYDETGDYRLLLMAGIPISIVAGMLIFWVGDYPELRAARATAAQAARA